MAPTDPLSGDARPVEGDLPAAEPVIVTMTFDAAAPEQLLGALARYVVITRGHQGCVNVDLAASATRPGRFVVISKWSTPQAQRAHMDSDELVALAETSRALLSAPAAIDLLDPISAHDLR